MHALGLEFGSAAQLSKRPGSVWNCLWGNALKRSPGIIRKSRVSYPGPGFLSSATWPSLPKKHYNGLINNQPVIPWVLMKYRWIFEQFFGIFFCIPRAFRRVEYRKKYQKITRISPVFLKNTWYNCIILQLFDFQSS